MWHHSLGRSPGQPHQEGGWHGRASSNEAHLGPEARNAGSCVHCMSSDSWHPPCFNVLWFVFWFVLTSGWVNDSCFKWHVARTPYLSHSLSWCVTAVSHVCSDDPLQHCAVREPLVESLMAMDPHKGQGKKVGMPKEYSLVDWTLATYTGCWNMECHLSFGNGACAVLTPHYWAHQHIQHWFWTQATWQGLESLHLQFTVIEPRYSWTNQHHVQPPRCFTSVRGRGAPGQRLLMNFAVITSDLKCVPWVLE